MVDYVLGPIPALGETGALHLHAPYVNVVQMCGEALTMHLGTR